MRAHMRTLKHTNVHIYKAMCPVAGDCLCASSVVTRILEWSRVFGHTVAAHTWEAFALLLFAHCSLCAGSACSLGLPVSLSPDYCLGGWRLSGVYPLHFTAGFVLVCSWILSTSCLKIFGKAYTICIYSMLCYTLQLSVWNFVALLFFFLLLLLFVRR